MHGFTFVVLFDLTSHTFNLSDMVKHSKCNLLIFFLMESTLVGLFYLVNFVEDRYWTSVPFS